MRIIKLNRFCLVAGVSLLFAACSGEDEGQMDPADAVSLKASIQSAQSGSRVTTNDSWTGMESERIAVRIGNEVKAYLADKNGNMASADPFYWQGQSVLTVEAWYPYNEGVKPEAVTVKADQSINSNFLASDCIEAQATDITPDQREITFTHRTARLVCMLRLENMSAYKATVTLGGLTGIEGGGNTVTTTADYNALLAPQTVAAGTLSFSIELEDNRTSSGVLNEELILEAGRSYSVELTVTPNNVTAQVTGSADWDASGGDQLDGNSPTVTPGNDNNAWNDNGGDQLDGSSPTVKPGDGNGSWNDNGGGTVDGNSPTVKPGDGSGAWNDNGGGTVDGNSPTVKPGDNSGSWNDNGGGTVDGSSPTVKPGDDSGSWNDKNDEKLDGSTPTVTPGDSTDSGNNGSSADWDKKEDTITGEKDNATTSN